MGSSNDDDLSERGRFATTSWSQVVAAAQGHSEASHQALEDLCQKYWYPLYAFLRRKGMRRTEAEDSTQSFLADLLEKQTLRVTDQARGRFRNFLMTCIANFVAAETRKQRAHKRGGGQVFISFDFERAEDRFNLDPGHGLTPQKAFDRNWAVTVIEEAMERLSQQYAAAGKRTLYDKLRGYLDQTEDSGYENVAKELDMTLGAIKVAVHRLRERYKAHLRKIISETVTHPEEVDDELRSLFRAFN